MRAKRFILSLVFFLLFFTMTCSSPLNHTVVYITYMTTINFEDRSHQLLKVIDNDGFVWLNLNAMTFDPKFCFDTGKQNQTMLTCIKTDSWFDGHGVHVKPLSQAKKMHQVVSDRWFITSVSPVLLCTLFRSVHSF